MVSFDFLQGPGRSDTFVDLLFLFDILKYSASLLFFLAISWLLHILVSWEWFELRVGSRGVFSTRIAWPSQKCWLIENLLSGFALVIWFIAVQIVDFIFVFFIEYIFHFWVNIYIRFAFELPVELVQLFVLILRCGKLLLRRYTVFRIAEARLALSAFSCRSSRCSTK